MNKRRDAKAPSTILWQIRVTEEEDSATDRLLRELSSRDMNISRSDLIRSLIREKVESTKKKRRTRTRA